MVNGLKRIKDVLSRTGAARALADTSARLMRADRAIKTVLPSMLADYCTVRMVTRKELTLEAGSQAVATHLRFHAPQLLERLNKVEDFAGLERISIKVGTLPQASAAKPNPRAPNPVSQTNLDMLRDTANSMASQELASALNHLAATIEKRQNKKPPHQAGVL